MPKRTFATRMARRASRWIGARAEFGHSLTVITVKAELAQRLVDLDPEEPNGHQVLAVEDECLLLGRHPVAG